jgi:uroporphyrinogen III methyltransferase/synthase
MQWFEKRPLLGKTIIVTRARAQASDLVHSLSELGAQCLQFPTIRVQPPDDWRPLDQAIERLAEYHWLIFTSVNGVKQFFERLFVVDKDVRALHHLRTAAIGPVTAAELLARGLKSDIVPETYRAESVVAAFKGVDIGGNRVLLPRAEEARPVLPDELRKMGARVDEVTVYRTVPVTDGAEQLVEALRSGGVDIVTFTSSSTVRNFKALLPASDFEALMRPVTVASIGPITSDTARKLGFEVHITAESFTIPGLVESIVRHCNA